MKRFVIILLSLFVFLLLYLHQQLAIYVYAYRLRANLKKYQHFVYQRDTLEYEFYQKANILKMNQWAEKNDFLPAKRKQVIALAVKKKELLRKNYKPGFFKPIANFFRSPGSEDAFAASQK